MNLGRNARTKVSRTRACVDLGKDLANRGIGSPFDISSDHAETRSRMSGSKAPPFCNRVVNSDLQTFADFSVRTWPWVVWLCVVISESPQATGRWPLSENASCGRFSERGSCPPGQACKASISRFSGRRKAPRG